jgi:hypothetical protein
MPKISHTSAFKLCEDGSCDEPKPGSAPESLECKKSDKCKGSGCYCQLFQRDKDAEADDSWDVTPVDGRGKQRRGPSSLTPVSAFRRLCRVITRSVTVRFAN